MEHLSLRVRFVVVPIALLVLASTVAFSPAATTPQTSSEPNVVLRWNEALLQGVRESSMGPPLIARALAIAHTCMFDAWAAYDDRAVGTQLGDSLRRPVAERTGDNKMKAMSYATYRAAVDLFPASRAGVFDPLMVSLGYDPADTTTDVTTPAGIGNAACGALLEFRHRDGSNQLGNEPGGQPGIPYSDYTGYVPVNDPMDLTAEFNPAAVHDVNRWQPLSYINAVGLRATPTFLGAHWNRVVPFALSSPSQFRSNSGPAVAGTKEFERQAKELLEISAHLTERQKTIADYWRDGPNTETPPGHWNLLAQFVSQRDQHGLNRDVRMFFALNNALFDAGISSWDNKIAFDSVRPITAIRWLYQGKRVRAWGGPGQGTQEIDGEDWFPYQPTTFPTPPFAEFTSGHSTFSAAAAEILRRFTGSDAFGASVTLPPGSSSVEPGITPTESITLSWPTFTAAADEAGISRRYGGIHFKMGDLRGRSGGRRVAAEVWEKVESYIKGTAPAR